MDSEPDEAELARRAHDGDREALAELVKRVRLPLFALAYAELLCDGDAPRKRKTPAAHATGESCKLPKKRR